MATPSVVSSVRDEKSEDHPNRPTRAKYTRQPKRSANTSNSFHKMLQDVLPMDIRKKLQEKPNRCIAPTTKPGNPQCMRSTKGSLEVLNNVPSTLTGDTIESTNDASITFVRDLIGSACCVRSHRKKHISKFDNIYRVLDELSEDDREVFDQWIMALATEPLSMPSTRTDVSAKRLPMTTRRQEMPAISFTFSYPMTSSTSRYPRLTSTSTILFSPSPSRGLSPTYIPNFIPYVLKSAPKNIEDFLHDRITRPLTKRELPRGYIYIYWFPGIFGFIKIGVTACADVTKRLKQWRHQCGHAVEAVYTELIPVDHAYRVEALVQAELRDVRFREVGCPGCGKTHIEWFQENLVHAKAVIEKYGGWMNTRKPYMPGVSGEDAAGWPLKPGENIEELCRPLERSVKEVKTRKKKSEKEKSEKAR